MNDVKRSEDDRSGIPSKSEIMTVTPNIGHLKSSSNTSVNSKCKKTYSLLSAFVRHTKLKTKKIKSKDKNNDLLTSSSSAFESPSREELELMLENFEKQLPSHETDKANRKKPISLTDSEISVHSPVKSKNKFFSKFLVKHSMSEYDKRQSEYFLSWEGDRKGDGNYSTERIDSNKVFPTFPISFINLQKPTLTTSLIQGLLTLQTLVSQLQQSERYLLQVFKRFITDASLQKELVDTLCAHSKLHLESERVANHLSIDMWSKQLEIEKTQQNALQDALASVIKQNRQLLSEYEGLFSTYEKLLGKFQCFTENDFNTKCVPGCEEEIQNVIKHNIELINKIENLCKQLEHFENELTNSKKQNEHLEMQLTSVSGQLNELEVTFNRTKTDYELQVASLNHQLKSKEKVLFNATEACQSFQKDLYSLEDQLKQIPITIDWTRLVCHEQGISYFIEFGRLCLDKLIKEIINLRSQVNIKQQDIESLVDTNGKLQDNLKKSTTELDTLSKKFDSSDKLIYEHKYKLLENERTINLEKMEKLKFEFEMEKDSLLKKLQHYEELQNESKIMFEQSKSYINTLTSENSLLRNQLLGQNKVRFENTSVKTPKEADSQLEKPVFTQTQYNQLFVEKQHLVEQFETIKKEYQKFLDNQNQKLQSQQVDSVRLADENNILLQKYEAEHQTVLSLQNERTKYLEEKSLLKVIFEHMKSEIFRLQKLESTVSNISKEANKLAIIAQYNKEVGQKLKTEIEDKDKIILKLRTSVEQLNDIQIKNTKEKLSLCYELSQLTQVKEKLDKELLKEFQKNAILDGFRNNAIQSANSQIEQIEEFQKKERKAFTELLKDMKVITKERDLLLKKNENMSNELEKSKRLCHEYSKEIEGLLVAKDENERKLTEYEKKYHENHLKMSRLRDKLSTEANTYDGNVKQLEKLIVQLRKEKVVLEDSVKYLQNNTQKLHNDLNKSRSNEKDLKDSLNKCLSEKAALEEVSKGSNKSIESLTADRENLMAELQELNLFCEKILADFEANLQATIQKEELLNQELEEKKCMFLESSMKNDQLAKELAIKENELHLAREECSNLKNIKVENDSMKLHLKTARQECENLYKQLEISNKQTHNEVEKYQMEINELQKHNEELQEKNVNLSKVELVLIETTEKLKQEQKSCKALSALHKEVSDKLVEAVKRETEEKETRRQVEARFGEFQELLALLRSEKCDLQEQTKMLLEGLNNTKNRINILVQEKETSKNSQTALQKRYNEILKKCISLEAEIRRLKSGDGNQEDLQFFTEEHEKVKKESEEYQKTIAGLRQEITQFQQKLLAMEFQKSELTLRLHELQRKYEIQLGLSEQLQSIQTVILKTVSRLRKNRLIDPDQYNSLINLVYNGSGSDVEINSS